VSNNQQTKIFLFQILLIHLDLLLFVYLKEQCPVTTKIKNFLAFHQKRFKANKLGPDATPSLNSKIDVTNKYFFTKSLFKYLTEKQRQNFFKYDKALKFEKGRPFPNSKEIRRLNDNLRRYYKLLKTDESPYF